MPRRGAGTLRRGWLRRRVARRSSRASASARRARVRHRCWRSQAAMPPTTTPTRDQHEDQEEQRQFQRQGRMRGIERIERDRDGLAVRHREQHDDDGERNENGEGDELAHRHAIFTD